MSKLFFILGIFVASQSYAGSFNRCQINQITAADTASIWFTCTSLTNSNTPIIDNQGYNICPHSTQSVLTVASVAKASNLKVEFWTSSVNALDSGEVKECIGGISIR